MEECFPIRFFFRFVISAWFLSTLLSLRCFLRLMTVRITPLAHSRSPALYRSCQFFSFCPISLVSENLKAFSLLSLPHLRDFKGPSPFSFRAALKPLVQMANPVVSFNCVPILASLQIGTNKFLPLSLLSPLASDPQANDPVAPPHI